MYEMLHALDTLSPGDLNALWATSASFSTMVNMPRIAYARSIVINRVLPAAPPGDLRQTGQVVDAADFLAEKFAPVARSVNRNAAVSISLILQECDLQGVRDKSHIAYVLASAHHESGMGRFMTEFASGSAYEGRRDLGNVQPGDGPRYKGRGFVQITGRKNYARFTDILARTRGWQVDLVGTPALAADPAIAAFILVHGMRTGAFTGRSLSHFGADPTYDFVNARRIVNGLDRASSIAAIARRYRAVTR
jgi:predicted chitinase